MRTVGGHGRDHDLLAVGDAQREVEARGIAELGRAAGARDRVCDAQAVGQAVHARLEDRARDVDLELADRASVSRDGRQGDRLPGRRRSQPARASDKADPDHESAQRQLPTVERTGRPLGGRLEHGADFTLELIHFQVR
jgi:hypothetical protein